MFTSLRQQLAIYRQLFFQIVLLITLIAMSYFVFSKPSYATAIPHFDKFAHGLSFFVVTWLTYEAFRLRAWALVLLMFSYALFIELIQGYLPYRDASWGDLLADCVGIAIFYVVRWLIHLSKKFFTQPTDV